MPWGRFGSHACHVCLSARYVSLARRSGGSNRILGMGGFGCFLHAIILDTVKKISLRCKMQRGVSF